MNASSGKHEGLSLLAKPVLAILILACLTIGAFLAVSRHYINALFYDVEKKYRQDLVNIVSVARHAVEPVLSRMRAGELSREEATLQIRTLIRTMTYEDQDGRNYVFMSSYDGMMLVQPFEPAKEMTSQWNLQDAHGVYIIRELVKAAQTQPQGSFVRYTYHLPGLHIMQEKLAYVVGLPELQCYIGTGMYMKRTLEEQKAILAKIRYASLWLFIAMLIPVSVSVMVILQRNRRLITEIGFRRKAEEDLKRSEANYRSIFENAVKGFFQTAVDGRLISANAAFSRICGYESPQQMMANGVSTAQHYADSDERAKLLRLINENGAVEDYEVQMRRKDGALIWIAVSSRVVRDERGNVLYYEGAIEDIHARRQAQEDVKASRKMLDDILQAASEFAITATDTEGVITVFNRGAELMLGYSADEVIGKKTPLVFHPEAELASRSKELSDRMGHPVKGIHVFTTIPEMEGSETREWTFVRKNGTSLPVSLVVTAIFSKHGDVIGYLGIASDITKRKQAEETSRQAEEKFMKIFMMSPVGIAITRAEDGLIVDINIILAEILGWELHEISGRTSLELKFWSNPSDRAVMLNELTSGRDVLHREFQFRRKDGTPRNGIYSARFINIAGGNYILFVLQDITDRKRTEKELQDSLLKLDTAQEIAKIGFWNLDLTTMTLEWSKGLKRIFDMPPDGPNPTYDEFCSYVHAEDEKFIRDQAEKQLHIMNATAIQYSYRIVTPKGVVKYLDHTGRQTVSPEGRLIGIYGSVQDVTELKQTGRELKEKEERLEGISRNMPGVVFQLYRKDNGEYDLSYVSERLMEYIGLPPDMAFLFQRFIAIIYEEDRERLLQSVREAMTTGTDWNFEGRFVKAPGEILWFQGLATPAKQENRLVLNGILLDITERKKAEEKFTKIFMTAPDCIAISRMTDGMIMDVNMGFEEITSWKHDEVVGKTSYEINFWADFRDREVMIHELKAGRDVLHREFQFRRKDKTARMGVYSARPIEIAGDQCLVFILNDVTERKQLEEERRKLEAQLSQSQKLDSIGQLASGVAHDFNNILMGIQGNAALMQMDYHPEHPHYQKLNRIEEHIRRGANLTRQLLGFAREGKYEVRILSLNDLIRKVAQFFLETHKEIEAEYQLQKDLDPVEADAGQIEQVLLNLFINAGHAMPKGGHLYIRSVNVVLREADTEAFQLKPGRFVKISISDTGIGMDAETIKRIFEPFFTTRLKEGGSGLGLASAYGIIRNHGGAIKVSSEPGVGSTFDIHLPASQKKAITEEPSQREGLVSGIGGILMVDDEPMILGAASEMLKILGYTVYPAASGQEACAVYAEKKDKINLVLLDMIMPGMSGAQVLKILRDINPGVRVILSSGYGMQGEVQKVMEAGCQGFIQKPYSFRELSNVVHQVLNPAQT